MLNKAAAFTDLHWGRKQNSVQHNEDCTRYIDWFCDNVQSDPSIDHIVFMGDWFDHRSSINIDTLNYSHRAAKKLNELGLPVYFIVGNHDLFHRHTRDVFSTVSFTEFTNFHVVNQPTVFPEMGPKGALVCPFLFHHEYDQLKQYTHLPVWWGHFEFKGFIVTGHSMRMPTGPEAEHYVGPLIFSGHFHKRQAYKNVIYVGSCFPYDFSDSDDSARGMCTYQYDTNDVQFFDWEECPTYQRCTLSDLLDKRKRINQGARVKCTADVDISFEESAKIKQAFVVKYQLREFTMEESRDVSSAIVEGEGVDGSEHLSVGDLILQMLSKIDTPQIDKDLLVEIYKGLPTA